MTAAERLLRYVQVDTQSNEFSDTCPSTDKQKVLALSLVEEMKACLLYTSPWPTPARGWKAPILPWNSGAKDCTASLARRWKPRSCGSGWPACSLGGRPYVKLSPICPLDILSLIHI